MALLQNPWIWPCRQQQVGVIAQSSALAWPHVQATMSSVPERLFLATERAHEGLAVQGRCQRGTSRRQNSEAAAFGLTQKARKLLLFSKSLSPQPAQQQHPAEEHFCHGPCGRPTDPEAMQTHKHLNDGLSHSTGSFGVLVRPTDTLHGPPVLLLQSFYLPSSYSSTTKVAESRLFCHCCRKQRPQGHVTARRAWQQIPASCQNHQYPRSRNAVLGAAGEPAAGAASPPHAGERELWRSTAPGELRAGSRLPRNPCAKSVR